MSKASSTLLVGQSGGATAVINASLVGVVEAAVEAASFARVLGMRGGIEGLLGEQFVDLTSLPKATRELLRRTPSAALGTGRYKLRDRDLDHAIEVLRRHDIHALVFIGGNDSADTAHRLHMHAAVRGYELAVVLTPKTVDNDLPETDHCPGYGSISRYVANATRDATYDTIAAPQLYPVKFIEVMGRDAGWVAAACALGFGKGEQDLTPLIYLPERPPQSAELILEEIEARVESQGFAISVVPETLRDAMHHHLGGETPDYVDQFGHPYFASPAAALARRVSLELGMRARFDRPGTASRMSISLASAVDLDEASRVGAEAARSVARGESDKMTALSRVASDDYRSEIFTAPLVVIANHVRSLPDDFIGDDGRSVTASFRHYALPLLGPDPFPPYGRLSFT
ncbi:MAG: diphosphate--fructose-6-phosphate 1-phosphotransferase [Thermomicrobiales bacterium]